MPACHAGEQGSTPWRGVEHSSPCPEKGQSRVYFLFQQEQIRPLPLEMSPPKHREIYHIEQVRKCGSLCTRSGAERVQRDPHLFDVVDSSVFGGVTFPAEAVVRCHPYGADFQVQVERDLGIYHGPLQLCAGGPGGGLPPVF